eukprot:scaffold18163_cov133-Isochrysis_galbana.AAC.5
MKIKLNLSSTASSALTLRRATAVCIVLGQNNLGNLQGRGRERGPGNDRSTSLYSSQPSSLSTLQYCSPYLAPISNDFPGTLSRTSRDVTSTTWLGTKIVPAPAPLVPLGALDGMSPSCQTRSKQLSFSEAAWGRVGCGSG